MRQDAQGDTQKANGGYEVGRWGECPRDRDADVILLDAGDGKRAGETPCGDAQAQAAAGGSNGLFQPSLSKKRVLVL